MQKQDRKPGEVSPAEAAWLMAGSILELLRDSGYPASETLGDFRALVAEPILNTPSRLCTVRNAPARQVPATGPLLGRGSSPGPA